MEKNQSLTFNEFLHSSVIAEMRKRLYEGFLFPEVTESSKAMFERFLTEIIINELDEKPVTISSEFQKEVESVLSELEQYQIKEFYAEIKNELYESVFGKYYR